MKNSGWLGWVCLKSIFVGGNAARAVPYPSHGWKQRGLVWPPRPALLHPTGDGHGPHMAALARGAEGTPRCRGTAGYSPRATARAAKLWLLGEPRARPTCPSVHPSVCPTCPSLCLSLCHPRGLQSWNHPGETWAPCPALGEGDEDRMRRREMGDAPLSPPAPSQERPRLGVMLPARWHLPGPRNKAQPVGHAGDTAGSSSGPAHGHQSRSEGAAVLPWRKGSS